MEEETKTQEQTTDYGALKYDDVVGTLSDDIKAIIPEGWAKAFGGKTLNDVFKSHVNAEGEMLKRVAIPGDDASDDDRRSFFNKLGCPESKDGYKFDDFELPEGAKPNEEFLQFAKGLFHAIGLNNSQANEAVKKWNEYQIGQKKALDKADKSLRDEAEDDLRKTWPGDKYDEKLAEAQQFYDKVVPDELGLLFQKHNLHLHPLVIKFFHELSGDFKETPAPLGGSKATTEPELTEEEKDKKTLDTMYPDHKMQGTTAVKDLQ